MRDNTLTLAMFLISAVLIFFYVVPYYFNNKIQSISLIDAIIQVESGGNPYAIGDNGYAVGILQIHPIMVRDVNRIVGYDKYDLNDRYDINKSKEMFWIYTNHYSKDETNEIIARRWNGGPRGDKKESTVQYWNKVKKCLEEKR